jgi:hypothetical protein
MQARVPAGLASELLEQDGPALGLEGMSEIVREAPLLPHRHVREHRAAAELAAFYPGGIAPLPTGMVGDDV